MSRRKQNPGTGRRRRRSAKGKGSLIGSLMLELIAIVAFLMMMSISSDNEHSRRDANSGAQGTAEFRSMVAGFFADHWNRHPLFTADHR